MKKILLISVLVCQGLMYAQKVDSTTVNKTIYNPENYISIDGLLLLFGTFNPGLERRIVDELSIFASVGMGNMWFTDIDQMFEIGIKYRLKTIFKNNFYAGLSYSKVSLTYNNKTASASSVGMLFGYYHMFFNWLRLDVNGGLYVNGDPMITFTEKSGNLTKTVTVGGLNFGGSLRFGIAF